MKHIYKYSILVIILVLNFFISPINKILNTEINLTSITYIFGKSLYDDITVSNEYVEVIDYYIDNDLLYIFPINGEIKLPISVSIMKIDKEVIEVVDNNIRYYIYNIDKKNKSLYQYVHANDVLGYTSDYYIIKCENIDYIVGKLIINYESI